MPESYSINNLFEKGLTREQFVQKYQEMKASGEVQASSIFEDGMDTAIGNIFDEVDTDKDGSISEAELVVLKGLGKGDKEILSDDDLEVIYQKVIDNILNKYQDIDSPEKMYKTAIDKSDGDIRYSSYIEDLDSDIETLTELMNNRRFSTTAKISDLQSQINDLLSKSKKLDQKTQEQYAKETEKLNDLRRKSTENKAKLSQKEEEFKSNQNEIELLKREMASIDREKNKDELAEKQRELIDLTDKNSKLSKEIETCKQKDSKLSKLIQKSHKKLVDMRSDALRRNDNIKSKIGQLQAKIYAEQSNSESDITNYQNRIQQLNAPRTYAYNQIPTRPTTEVMSSYNNDSNVQSTAGLKDLEKQGVRYSAAKGQKLAQDIGSHARGFIGRCSNRVANGLQRTGLGNERMPSACQMDDALRWNIASGKNKNFREIKVNSQAELRNLPAGCVVIYEAGAAGYNSKNGHIEVTLGNGTAASDGITRNMRYSDRMSVFVPVESA